MQHLSTDLSREERLRLMRFACAFAWADLEVRAEERVFLRNLARNLNLDDMALEEMEAWFENPPRPEEIDPQDIPLAHRNVFLAAAQAIVSIDGEVSSAEADILDLFRQLLMGESDLEE